MKQPEQLSTTLKQLAQASSESLDTTHEESRAALAVWRVPETRKELIRSEDFSDEAVERLDELAANVADTKAEASAKDAAARFQPGVLDPSENEREAADPEDKPTA